MFAWGDRLKVAVTSVVVMAAGPAAAQGSGAVSAPVSAPVSVPASVSAPVLVGPVQGSEALRVRHGERLRSAVRRALEVRGYPVAAAQELLGQSVVACQTPECVEQVLDAAGAAFAIVPAIWSREHGDEELTLTLVQRSGRSLNAKGVVGDDLSGTAGDLVGDLLTRQAAAPRRVDAPRRPRGSSMKPAHPHAWKAGPVILIAGGAAAVIAIEASPGGSLAKSAASAKPSPRAP